MKDLSLPQIVDHFLEEKRNGKDFSEIRKELSVLKSDDEVIKEILKEIDHQILLEDTVKVKNSAANESIWIGVVLIVLGVLSTFASYLDLIAGGRIFILMYGSIISGVVLVIKGKNKKKNGGTISKDIRSGIIRKRR